ncbi:MAG: hypothetical protein CEN87_397 [Parcubacteria group bacterium Licking1014_1]|nr:MAG: hypothetical protein CEN87_397 [Parcubacteria group bacterium Licking1014_1]
MSTNNTVLKGGLAGCQDNGAVLEKVRKKLAAKKEIRLSFPNKAVKKEDGRMDSRELTSYVQDIADGAHEWVVTVACPFLRELERDIQEVGDEIRFDQCEDSDQTKQERQKDYEATIEALRCFSSENDGILREEAKITGRQQFVDALCLRVRHMTEIGLLVFGLRHAKTKNDLKSLLTSAKDGAGKDAKKVFVATADKKAPISAFEKGYTLASDVFGRYRDFASKKLAEVVNVQSKELADEFLIEPEKLLFGDRDDINERAAWFSWKFQGRDNAIRVCRVNGVKGDRLYIVDAIGKPLEALEAMREEWEDPFILLRLILAKDGEHLCLGKMVDGKPQYEFGGFVNPSVFPMVRWIRTAAGARIPSRLLSNDETRLAVDNSAKPNGKDASNNDKLLVDNDGKEVVDPEIFYFRKVNGGAGTIVITLPEGFVLNFAEAKDEQQEVVAPERSVRVSEETKVRIRRTIIRGKPKIVFDGCNNMEVFEEFRANGFLGEWAEKGQKNWPELPGPLRALLSFGYKQGCLNGEIKPNTSR